ncbi:MAG: hypothetical protein NZ920_02510 [Aigarchaeota archaeon]|nr:hypothetical protein [Aigarchaeota archaeon]MDW8092503.1 hypothetical protein [Nitrososphaerota archaeon]
MRRLRVFLYNDPSTPNLRLDEVADYLKDLIESSEVLIRPEFLHYHIGSDRRKLDDIARAIASSRVIELYRRLSRRMPLLGEVEVEKRLIESGSAVRGVMYDGYELADIYNRLIADVERDRSVVHVAFTSRLVGTFGEDGRYHARVIIASFPSIISTTGVVEAPAKPREFYLQISQVSDPSLQSILIEELKRKYAGRFIDYNDERLTEVMKGYVLQAVFYQVFGEAFCDNRDCRLFNAHWQEELIHSQIVSGKICDSHRAIL